MKAETYRRKAEELREKATNTNPRFWRKIEAMEAEADRLEERATEKEAEEAESESDEDEDWDDENDVSDWDDCDDDEDEEDEDDDNDDDDEFDEDEIRDRIRDIISGEVGDDESIVDALFDLFEDDFHNGVHDKDDDLNTKIEDSLFLVSNYISYISQAISENHTMTYILAMIHALPINDNPDDAYNDMTKDEIIEDLEATGKLDGFCSATIEYMNERFDDFEFVHDLISALETYDEAYKKALERYRDEERAKTYADACVRGDEIIDFDDDFESTAQSDDWYCDEGNGGDPFWTGEEYSSDSIISFYYEEGHGDASFSNDGTELDMGGAHFYAKGYWDVLNEPEEDIGEP